MFYVVSIGYDLPYFVFSFYQGLVYFHPFAKWEYRSCFLAHGLLLLDAEPVNIHIQNSFFLSDFYKKQNSSNNLSQMIIIVLCLLNFSVLQILARRTPKFANAMNL
jgi:hypothetical protein